MFNLPIDSITIFVFACNIVVKRRFVGCNEYVKNYCQTKYREYFELHFLVLTRISTSFTTEMVQCSKMHFDENNKYMACGICNTNIHTAFYEVWTIAFWQQWYEIFQSTIGKCRLSRDGLCVSLFSPNSCWCQSLMLSLSPVSECVRSANMWSLAKRFRDLIAHSFTHSWMYLLWALNWIRLKSVSASRAHTLDSGRCFDTFQCTYNVRMGAYVCRTHN